MNFFIPLLILSAALSNFEVLGKIAIHAKTLQQLCVDYSPHFMIHQESLNALTCGSSVNNVLIKDLFITTELYHLLIVSGSHLQTLIWLMNKSTRKKSFIFYTALWLTLTGFTLMTGFAAPILRALTAELLRALSHYFRWNWSLWHVQIIAGCSLLALNPAYFNSFSFYLSWLASLGFLIPFSNDQSKVFKHFLTCLCISLLMTIPFEYRGPLGLFMNFLLGSVLSLILFPLALATKGLSLLKIEFGFVFDWFFEFILRLLISTKQFGLAEDKRTVFPIINWQLWLPLLALQWAFFYLRWSKRKSFL